MNFTEYALKNKALVYFFVFVLVVGGIYSFFTMSKLEDPAITVKQAMVVTTFPGASAWQVELEVTDVLEKSIRSMGDLDHVESRSMDDISLILVELSSTVPLAELQQNWDILRRKVANVQAQLPAGAQPSTVMDDFGDVYGMFYAMTSDGLSENDGLCPVGKTYCAGYRRGEQCRHIWRTAGLYRYRYSGIENGQFGGSSCRDHPHPPRTKCNGLFRLL